MVTYCVTKIIPTCSPVIGQFFDTMIVASTESGNYDLSKSTSWKVLETVLVVSQQRSLWPLTSITLDSLLGYSLLHIIILHSIWRILLTKQHANTYLAITNSWVVFCICNQNIIQSRPQISLIVGKVNVIRKSTINI